MCAGRLATPVATELTPSGRDCSGPAVFLGGKKPAPVEVPHLSEPILGQGILNSRPGRSVSDLRLCRTRNCPQSSYSVTRGLPAAQDITSFLHTALSVHSAVAEHAFRRRTRLAASEPAPRRALGDRATGRFCSQRRRHVLCWTSTEFQPLSGRPDRRNLPLFSSPISRGVLSQIRGNSFGIDNRAAPSRCHPRVTWAGLALQ